MISGNKIIFSVDELLSNAFAVTKIRGNLDRIPVDHFIFEIELLVTVRDWAENTTRITDGYRACRDVLCDNAAGANDRMVADRDARENTDPCANPAVTSDMHRHVKLVRSTTPQFRENGVTRRANHHIGTKLRAIADVNMCIVHKRKIVVDVHVMPEVQEAASPVGKERRLNETAFADFRQHFTQKLLAFSRFCRTRAVEIVKEFHVCFLGAEQPLIHGLVQGTIVQL